MDGIAVGLERIGQRYVEPVLPHRDFAVLVDAMVVPRPVGREHEIAQAEGDLVAVHDRVGAGALHDEAQRRGGVRCDEAFSPGRIAWMPLNSQPQQALTSLRLGLRR